MSMHKQTSEPNVTPQQAKQPVGGAIIDAQGREVPITETMIQQACNELDKNWIAPPQKKR